MILHFPIHILIHMYPSVPPSGVEGIWFTKTAPRSKAMETVAGRQGINAGTYATRRRTKMMLVAGLLGPAGPFLLLGEISK